MKLTYRGVEYDHNPPMLEITAGEMTCQYRGHAVPYTYVRHVPIPQPAQRLSYRGVAYQTTRHGQVQPLVAQSPNADSVRPGISLSNLRNKLMGTSPAAQARRELLKTSSRLHQANISRSLQHRIEVAKAQGNHDLLEQLEAEMSQSV
ncbi:MAG: DUF4278 domain-containing protein [Cyanobacteria bacterium J06632_3]